MTTDKQKLIDKLTRVKELAERGAGGESTVAQEMLDRLMLENGIRPEELGEERTEIFEFFYRSKTDLDILTQVICMVLETGKFKCGIIKRSRKLRMQLTKAQFLEIDLLYHHHRTMVKQALDDAVSAYIHANDLYAPNDEGREDLEISDEDRERQARVAQMAEGIEPSTPLKQLEAVAT